MSYRLVDAGIWTDPWFFRLPSDHKLVYLYFITNPHVKKSGFVEVATDVMERDLRIKSTKLIEIVLNLSPKIRWFRGREIIWVVRFLKHQSMYRNKSYYSAAIEEVKKMDDDIVEEFSNEYELFLPEISKLACPPPFMNRKEENRKEKKKKQKETAKGKLRQFSSVALSQQEIYNSEVDKSQSVKKPVKSRRLGKKILSQLKDLNTDLDTWRIVCEEYCRDKFVCGENDRGWRGNLEHLSREKTYTRYLESALDISPMESEKASVIHLTDFTNHDWS